MALSRTDHVGSESNSGYGTASYSTASFTPPNSSLLAAVVGGADSSDISGSDFSCSGGGLTWTLRGTVQVNGGGSYWSKIQIFTAPVVTGASMTVTVDHANNINIWAVHVMSWTGYDPGTPTGATGSDTALEDAGQFNLSASPASTSEVLAARFLVPNESAPEAATPGTGWTEIFDTATPTSDGWGGLETQARGGSTSSSVDWTDTTVGTTAFSNIGLAVEIIAASGGGDTLFAGGGIHFI